MSSKIIWFLIISWKPTEIEQDNSSDMLPDSSYLLYTIKVAIHNHRSCTPLEEAS